MRQLRLLITAGLSLTALFILLSPFYQIAGAAATTRYVKTNGSGSVCTQASPCVLADALEKSNDGDTIVVAAGTYTGSGAAVVTLTQSITLYGGWDGAPSGGVVRDPAGYPSLLDGERQRRVVHISGNITPTIDGFVIARGNATGLIADCLATGASTAGCGGGVYVSDAHPIIVNNVITNNVAVMTSTFPISTGYGGGVYLEYSPRAVISGNLIVSNAGSLANQGWGGGMFLQFSNEGTLVHSNQVISNYATTTNSTGWGGGIGISDSGLTAATLQGNLIQGNWANNTGFGLGAGLFQWYGAGEFLNNRVTGNFGGEAVYFGYSPMVIEGNWIVDNATSYGLALVDLDGGEVKLINNIIASSNTGLLASGYVDYPFTATLLHNTLAGSGAGSGVYVESGFVTLHFTNTIIAGFNVGITNTTPASSTVFAEHTLFYNNATNYGGGVMSVNALTGDPRFANPAAGDYHIGSGSAAIDVALNAGVADDIDGDARPIGFGYDIGADERRYQVYLPAVLKNSGP